MSLRRLAKRSLLFSSLKSESLVPSERLCIEPDVVFSAIESFLLATNKELPFVSK